MDSRLIDVMLGLALVFAVSSLAITVMQQLFDSLVSLRGRVARQQVLSFVGDDAAFAEQLLKHPLFVSLSQGTVNDSGRRPSWINADTMVTALLGTLSEALSGGQRPASPIALVHALRGATPGQAGTSMTLALASLAQGVEQDWPAFERRLAAWYGDVGERSVGWYKRYTQGWLLLWGLVLAASLNVNPFLIAQRLWEDEALRKATANVAIQVAEAHERAAAAASAPAAVPDPANGASAPAKAAATSAATQTALLAPLLARLPAPRLAETNEVEKLVADLGERLLNFQQTAPRGHAVGTVQWQAVHLGLDQVQGLRQWLDVRRLPDDQSAAALRKRLDSERGLQAQLGQIEGLIPSGPEHVGLRQSVAQLRDAIRAEGLALAAPKSKPSLDCKAPAAPEWAAACTATQNLVALRSQGLPMGWSAQNRFEPFDDPVPDAAATLAGWMVLALGCSLGAPFWFDLIKQLAKLRAPEGQPGSTPGSTAAQAASSEVSTLTRTPVPSSEAQPMSDALNDAEQALSEAEVQRLQHALGFGDSQLSGHFDGPTREAIRNWQTSRQYLPTGELTALQINELSQGGGSDEDFIG